MRFGVIAIQGNIEEHIYALNAALEQAGCKAEVVRIKHKGIVPACEALIIPGGESTTIGNLMEREGISHEIRKAANAGIPVMGTCAGLVLLAKYGDGQVERTKQPLLGLMDTSINRNAFGRQKESFEAPVDFKSFSSPFNAVFIRAPCILEAGEGVEILSRHHGLIVGARQKNMLALAFHPELTDDLRIHEYFLKMII
jgi:5'-phosphate synthase pdxT subunit